jgi:hypothetical protein
VRIEEEFYYLIWKTFENGSPTASCIEAWKVYRQEADSTKKWP